MEKKDPGGGRAEYGSTIYSEAVLADWLAERFDIVRGKVNSREDRMDIWLDEQKILLAERRLRASEVISPMVLLRKV